MGITTTVSCDVCSKAAGQRIDKNANRVQEPLSNFQAGKEQLWVCGACAVDDLKWDAFVGLGYEELLAIMRDLRKSTVANKNSWTAGTEAGP